MIASYLDKKNLSLYQPSLEIQEITKLAKENYAIGHEILTRAWPELNDMSVVDRDNKDKRVFNAYVDESCDDPKEAWKWRGTRSAARKKALEMHAHLTSGFMFPMVSAQDQNNEEDLGVSDFMRDMLIWMGDNSNYRESFLQVVMGMLTSPVTYMGAEFAEVMQKVKVKLDSGEYATKEVLDEELSGFRAPVYGASEVLITNAYVQNIQQQTCVIKQKHIDYSDAQKKYGNHENFQFVQRGINSIFDEQEGLFYDVKDDENPNGLLETVCMWRGEDTEVAFLGGVYMGDENVGWNPMIHRDNFNNPKYDVVPFGYYRISEHFFYFKSLCNALGWDDQLIDAMYENVMNREFFDLNPATLLSGYDGDEINTSVAFPGATIVTANKDAKAQPILPPKQTNGYQALQLTEDSIKEGSISDVLGGQLPQASQKAFSVARAEKNAQTILKGVGQALGLSIMQYGRLMVDIAINHFSTPMIEEVAGNAQRLKYRQFVLPRQQSKGKKITKILRYGENLIGRAMSLSQIDMENIKLYEESGDSKSILVINPELASRMRYLIHIDPEEMFAQGKEFTQSLLGQMYQMLRQDPLIDAEALTRKLMTALFRSEGEELMAKKSDIEKLMASAPQGVLPKEQTDKMRALAGSIETGAPMG